MTSKQMLVAVIAQVKEIVSADLATLAYRGQILKGKILASTGANPVAGDVVVAEHLPASDEWYIVAIVPP